MLLTCGHLKYCAIELFDELAPKASGEVNEDEVDEEFEEDSKV